MNDKQNTKPESATGPQGRLDTLVMCDCYPMHCEHDGTCWCEPKTEVVNGTKIVIHNKAN